MPASTLLPVAWSSFTDSLSEAALHAVAQQLQAVFAAQRLPVPFQQFLTLEPSQAALLLQSDALLRLRVAEWLAADGTVTTYEAYLAGFSPVERPAVQAFLELVQAEGFSAESFLAWDAEAIEEWLRKMGTDRLYTLLVQAFQFRGHKLLIDDQGRYADFLASIPSEAERAALQAAFTLLAREDTVVSLYSVSRTALNRLAQALWAPNPGAPAAAVTAFLEFPLQRLQLAAQRIARENYDAATAREQLLQEQPETLRKGVEALLTTWSATVSEDIVSYLATTPLATLASQAIALPANHAFVYALAQGLQDTVRAYLAQHPLDIPPFPAATQLVTGQVLGLAEQPLASFFLRLTQVLSDSSESVALSTLQTGPDGRFSVQVPRYFQLTLPSNQAPETVIARPTVLQIEIFRPEQELTTPPAATRLFSVATAQPPLQVTTTLTAEAPLVPSLLLEASDIALPTDLQAFLTSQQLTSLADIRAVGGLLRLPDAPLTDAAAMTAARLLDALAQLELVSPDMAFNTRVIAQGIFSPTQLLNTHSRDEFVQALSGNDDAQRLSVAAYYEQTVVVEALTQTLGLYAASEQRVVPVVLPFPVDPQGEYEPGPQVPFVEYKADNQCDCAACRSAVGPMAYLAALLNYAVTKLKLDGQPTQAVTASALQTQFLQPFCDLPVSCQHAEEKVCQYRLVIEVLHRHLGTTAVPLSALQPYITTAYEALLQSLGSSGPELQQAMQPTAQLALANRLRLPLETLTALQSSYGRRTASESTRPLLEADLERQFGLRSTSRDALSTGLDMDKQSTGLLQRWSFQGIEAGLNTDAQGFLFVEVWPATASQAKPLVTVHTHLRSPAVTAPLADTAVAAGILVQDPGTPSVYRAMFYPQHDSGLRGSVVLRIPDQAPAALARTTFTLSVVPAVTAGRLQVLVKDWQSQDAASRDLLPSGAAGLAWTGLPFIIDPDVIGPDDIRPLNPTALYFDSRAFRIWHNRYAFLNSLGTQDLRTVVDQLTTPLVYQTIDGLPQPQYSVVPWNNSFYPSDLTGNELLDRLAQDVRSSDAAALARSAGALAAIGISAPAFSRLQELRLKAADSRTPTETEEAIGIVQQSLKQALAQAWASEEVPFPAAPTHAANVTLSGRWFQTAIHEPREGDWVARRGDTPIDTLESATAPVIDPDALTPLDLPDPGLGSTASQLWQERKSLLQAKQQAILASGAAPAPISGPGLPAPLSRADRMLHYAYRLDPQSTVNLPLPEPFTTLSELLAAYQETTHPQHEAAAAYVTQTLALYADEVDRLQALRAQAAVNPTDSLWAEMASVLARGWKRAVAYTQPHEQQTLTGTWEQVPSWTDQEDTAFSVKAVGPEDLLLVTRKQRLPKWRASVAARARWVAALAQAYQRPLIDPDQLLPGDFRQAGEKRAGNTAQYLNSAFALYSQRLQLVRTWYTEVPTQLAGIAAELGTSESALTELHRQRLANVDVTAAVRRLNMTPAALDVLMAPVAIGEPDQTSEVRHILVQVRRERHYADWARQEMAQDIYLSPLFFRDPAASTTLLTPTSWRSSPRERRLWQQQLAARFEQAQATVAAQEQAVKSVEDQYLPLLRAALLDTIQIIGASTRDAKADRLEATYLLDFKIACCQHTTRVAQAIEVLQKLFFNHRHGLPSAETHLVLTSAAAGTFDNEWQWLSSYERWRSLMFLYLYPENLLLPTLKPQQTTQFHDAVTLIRQSPQLTPATAKAYVAKYETALLDLNTLQLQASAQTYVDLTTDSTSGSSARQHAVFQVGLSASRQAYWNVYFEPSAAYGTPRNYEWTPIQSTRLLERIVGAVIFQNASHERFLLVFAFVRTGKSDPDTGKADLVFALQRLRLSTFTWEEDFQDLELGGEGLLEENNVIVVEQKLETLLPLIVGIRNRHAEVTIEELNTHINTGIVSITGNYVSTWLGYAFRQADLFTARLSEDGSAAAIISTNTLLGFSEVKLWSGIGISKDLTLLTLAQRVGPSSSFELETLVLDNAYREEYQPMGYARLTNLLIISRRFETLTIIGNSPAATMLRLMAVYATQVNFVYATQRLRVANQAEQIIPVELGSNPTYRGQRLIDNHTVNETTFQNFQNTYELFFEQSDNGDLLYKVAFTVAAEYDLSLLVYSPRKSHAFWVASPGVPQAPPYVLDYVGQHYRYIGATGITSTYAEEARRLPSRVVQEVGSSAATLVNTITLGDARAVCTYVSLAALPAIHPAVTRTNLVSRSQQVQFLFAAATGAAAMIVRNTLWEAYCLVPLQIALDLSKARYYEEALAYFRLVYDYTQPAGQRMVFPELISADARLTNQSYFTNTVTWLADAANPHTLAGLRRDSYLRYVVASIAGTLLGYADSEFTRDSSESVSRARSLYELAGGLLRQDILVEDVQDCRAILNQVDPLVEDAWLPEWESIKQLLALINQRDVVLNVLQDRANTPSGTTTRGIIWLFSQAQQDGSWSTQFGRAWQLVNAQLAAYTGQYETLCSTQNKLGGLLDSPVQRFIPSDGGTLGMLDQTMLDAVAQTLAARQKQQFETLAQQIGDQAGETDYAWLAQKQGPATPASPGPYPAALQLQLALTNRPFVPFLGVGFCVPTNPVPYALLLHVELNLYKIRTCRNIAGVQRELDPYAAPTDTTTGMPVIGANGQLTRTGRLVIPATQYRYAYIIERARQLVSLAQQAEAALLSTLEKHDAEAYNLLKARQDIAVSRATIQLQDLRLSEAEDSIDLAQLQLQRSELMEAQYDAWLDGGLNEFEKDMLEAIHLAAVASAAQTVLQSAASGLSTLASVASNTFGAAGAPFAAASVVASLYAGLAGASAALLSARSQQSQFLATAQRREQEWTFQRNLAGKDIEIGQQQIHLSEDRLRIVGQEKRISELQLDHAESVLNFLTTKFTNAELYDWMSQVLESAYSYFLQQATATARTAELQLAFERQEVPAGFIQEDYWTAPADSLSLTGTTTASVDRKGLTGSVRLLQDLTRLDQYAFETNRRKLQLTKTVSLAQAFPSEFVRFRETGVLPFALPQTSFDADFPGHYLRIIRRVRTSVIALVPPTEGIKAKLTTTGVSRVVVDGTPFQTLTLPRQPEAVALTSPFNATGLFELEQQPGELLYPFEGMGVDAAWVFSMQKAANGGLQYGTIADVLITIEYTALESASYAQQVAQSLGTERQLLLAFSFRNQFADQWYDLHHAADLAAKDQYVASFQIEATDLPANLREVRIKSLSLYLDLPTDDEFTDRAGLELTLARGGVAGSGGTAQTNQYGLISTRTGVGAGPLYTGNAAALISLLGASPVGEWVLSLGDNVRNRLRARLDQGKVNDLYLILEVEGQAPAYTLV